MENNNNNSPENQNDVNFETYDEFSVVEPKSEKKDNKLPIIIIICVLVVALLAGIALYIAKSIDNKAPENPPVVEGSTEEHSEEPDKLEDFVNQAMQEKITNENGSEISREEYLTLLQQQLVEATTILQQNVGSTSPHKIEEKTTVTGTTSANSQQETTTNKQQNKKVDAQIKAFFNRSFYIQGAFYSGNTGDPLYMSLDGDNYEMLTNLDGTEISFLKLGDSMYLKRPAVHQYTELTKTFFDALGMDPEMMKFNFGDTKYDDIKDKFQVNDIVINGNPGLCYYYKNTEQAFKFYAENDELRQIEIYDADGSIVSQFAIDYFSESIPGDQLTLKGYEKTGMGTLFADLM